MNKKFTNRMKDPNIECRLTIIRNNGIVFKGSLNKKKFYEFITDIEVENPKYLSIKKIECFAIGKDNKTKKLCNSEGTHEHMIETSFLNANKIRVKCIIEYKISFGVTKKLTVTCDGTL